MNLLNRLLIISCLALAPAIIMAECVITGCNGSVCSNTAQDSIGICKWEDQFACYKQFGVCAQDANGNCGWQPNPELDACLTKLKQVEDGVLAPSPNQL